MKTPRISRRWLACAAAAGMAWPMSAAALCASPAETGRWRNADPNADISFVDVKMVDCGDQVLNGEQTKTRYSLKVWVRQSTGKPFGRPAVSARYRAWEGKQWLYGRVPTGGYQDHVWMRAMNNDGKKQLRVLIKHESLDSKPSASSSHWFNEYRR